MSKLQKKPDTLSKDFTHLKTVGDISEYELKANGLKVLYKYIPDTKIVTTNLTYLVGARDEGPGETGLAHMLEHMLFKPTDFDLERKTASGAMVFEREVGVVLNANTWKDRTTYYFSYGREHFERAIQIEAERMRDLILSNKEFLPERTNVLSEFDMYNGDPHFALAVAMSATALYSHPYGHETIGFREDIEGYTVAKLQGFYDKFYRPNNAILMVIGDIDLKEALDLIHQHFCHLEAGDGLGDRPVVVEPKQEGIRRTEIERPGSINLLTFGLKHAGFPSKEWHTTMLAGKFLAGSDDSYLQKKLVDSGLASEVSYTQEPTKDLNIAQLSITLTDKSTHQKMESLVCKCIEEIKEADIKKKLTAIVTKSISEEIFSRDSSLNIAAELTEYVAAGCWPTYFETEAILSSITPKDIRTALKNMFKTSNLTVGTYKST